MQDADCHYTLSLNDGARTTPERCHEEYTGRSQRMSAAVMELSTQDLEKSGVASIIDSPNDQTHAHVDALYERPMSRGQRRGVAQSLASAANRRAPVYLAEAH